MPGDTIWSISRKYGISVNDLINANPQISSSGVIYVGQTINIPSTNKSTYTVMSGDTLWSISRKLGISINNLLAANPGISSTSYIYPGQIINIPTTSVPTTPSAPSDTRNLETEVIRLVNLERAKVGRTALVENKELTNLARLKSQDFINKNYFSHTSPTYGSPFDMMKKYGISYTSAAENIAAGQRTAAEVMNSWMNSTGHKANILNSTFNQIGVGVAKDNNGKLYWTQMFIRS